MDDVKPQDAASGLVERTWVRRSKRHGDLTEQTLEGEPVKATLLGRHGGLHHAAGTVRRNAAGELVVEIWADGICTETPIPRDANVDKGRSPA